MGCLDLLFGLEGTRTLVITECVYFVGMLRKDFVVRCTQYAREYGMETPARFAIRSSDEVSLTYCRRGVLCGY